MIALRIGVSCFMVFLARFCWREAARASGDREPKYVTVSFRGLAVAFAVNALIALVPPL